MILEVATLNIKAGMSDDFERAFQQASSIIASMPGYISHELHKCIEVSDRYLLLVYWETLEDHTIGFRQSSEYQTWKKLLHHFYEPFPAVEHFKPFCIIPNCSFEEDKRSELHEMSRRRVRNLLLHLENPVSSRASRSEKRDKEED